MSDYFQPAEDNGDVLSKIMLLALGIFIGGTLMFCICWLTGFGSRGVTITHVDGAGPGAAGAMETLPPGPVQAPDEPMPAMMQAPPVSYVQTGAAVMLPEQMPQTQVYTTAAPQALYAGQMMDDPNHQVGRNGLRANPCVDPPSCRGRAYSQPLQ